MKVEGANRGRDAVVRLYKLLHKGVKDFDIIAILRIADAIEWWGSPRI